MIALPSSLLARFGERLQQNVSLAPYTSARIGGPADFLLVVKSAAELEAAVVAAWEADLPFTLLGSGSNVLIGDKGIRGLVILNRAGHVRFIEEEQPRVWAESGAGLSQVAQRAAARGYGGLEWAATVPGTVGGAVYGNAGAFGGDMAGSLLLAHLITPQGRQSWNAQEMGYGYRTSRLKRGEVQAVVLAAELRLELSTPEQARRQIAAFSQRRKATQPPGASMGSMFKNPPGDYAGRLIEAAGLKGLRIGNVEVSPIHANFFINHGQARASDVRALIEEVQTKVREAFGISLELEIEFLGEW